MQAGKKAGQEKGTMANRQGSKPGGSKKCHGKRKAKTGSEKSILTPDVSSMTESSNVRDIELDPEESLGALNKREILNELSLVRKRLKAKFSRWEAGHTTYVGHIAGNTDESLFPRGFGYFLMSEAIPREEAYLEAVREMIMNISSSEIQDGLLLFLYDYVVQSKQLREVCQRRQEVLSSVHDWLKSDFGGLKDHPLDNLDEALNADGNIRRLYLKTLNVLERLGILKKQLVVLERSRKLEPGKEESTVKSESETAVSEGSEFQYSGPNDPTETLGSMVQSIRSTSNDELIDSIQLKLRMLASMLSTWDLDIRQARAHIRRRQEERERYVEDIEDIRNYNDRLLDQIKHLKELKESSAPTSPDRLSTDEEEEEEGVPEAEKVTKKDFSCQVCEDSLEDLKTAPQRKPQASAPIQGRRSPSKRMISSRRRGSQAKTSKGRSKGQKKGDQLLEHKGGEKSTENWLAKSPSRSSELQKAERLKKALLKTGSLGSMEVSESSLHLDKDKSPRVGAKTSQSAAAVVIVADSSEYRLEERAKKISQSQLADEIYSYWEERGRRKNSRPYGEVSTDVPSTSEAENSMAIPYDQLSQLLQRHINNLLAMAQPLLDELIALRRNARNEIKHIKDREARLSDMDRSIDQFLQQIEIEKERLPVLDLNPDRTNVVVSNRNTEPHKCSLCVCHDTTTETLDVGQVGSTLLLKRTLDVCTRYSALLHQLGETYVGLVNKMSQGRSIIGNLLGQLVWGELGTSDYSNLDEDMDSEMVWLLDKARHTPLSLPDLKKHCIFTTSTVRLIVRDTVAILKHAKIRMTDLRSQNEELRQLEKELNQARGILDDYALQITRLRAGSNLLYSGVTIAMSKCPYCKCYNSLLDDNSRTTSVADRKAANRLTLMNTTALLQQALGGVLRSSENESTVLAGVDPRVIEEVQDTQCRLSAAIDCMSDEDLPKKVRLSI